MLRIDLEAKAYNQREDIDVNGHLFSQAKYHQLYGLSNQIRQLITETMPLNWISGNDLN